jgi:tRNA (cmo5U34)-methyltransferase
MAFMIRHTGPVTRASENSVDAAPGSTHVSERGWTDPDQVDWYLGRIGGLAPRLAGEQLLHELLPELLPDGARCVLDLGCGDGRLSALVLDALPQVEHVVAIDTSPPMLAACRARFADDPRVDVREGDLDEPVDALGAFDVVVSGMAIHHVEDGRKRALFGEIARLLEPGGWFANLEVVASVTPAQHATFLAAIGREADDPEDRLAPVDDQLGWMRDAGLTAVDCLWRWRGLALLTGQRPLVV